MFARTLLATAIALAGLPIQAAAPDRSEFEKWMQQETTSYREYRDKRDQEFTSFLKTQWKEMQTFKGMVRDTTPKPKTLPVAPPVMPVLTTPVTPPVAKVPEPAVPPAPVKPPLPKVPDTTKAPDVPPVPSLPVPPVAEVKPDIKPELKPVVPAVPLVTVPSISVAPEPVKVAPVAVPALPAGKTVDIPFYGQTLRFSYDPALAKPRLASRIDGKAISDHWSALSLADYEPLLKQVDAQRAPLQLNDWGYALLTHRLAQAMYPDARNEQALFTWFVMTKAGYKARIAYDNASVYLLMPSRQPIYAATYFTFDNQRYYALSFDGSKYRLDRVFTYDGQYPGASKLLDMRLSQSLNTRRQDKVRLVKFRFNDQDYQVKVDTDDQTIAWLQTYPQLDINLYFAADVNRATGNPLLQQLKPLVQGKSEQDAVNLLLRFVQTAFPYKTDEQQFGVENYLFPEETLYYPYSDCEDRSVFFAWLVKNLVGLDVVGLDYPGHVATAVRFNENVAGDSIRHNGQRYVISDPTYINANAGMAMPDFKKVQPKVITF